MRESKYRIWDEEHKQMIFFSLADLLAHYGDESDYNLLSHTPLFRMHQSLDADRVMECTGIRDSNDNEVYEGDIVVTNNDPSEMLDTAVHYRGAVTYDKDHCGYCIDQPGDRYAPSLRNIHINNIEIIGNIYETPEKALQE